MGNDEFLTKFHNLLDLEKDASELIAVNESEFFVYAGCVF
jgi:hypothetical protein